LGAPRANKNERALLCETVTVPVRTAPQIALALYSWLGSAKSALCVALADRNPPRDAEHGYTNSSQND